MFYWDCMTHINLERIDTFIKLNLPIQEHGIFPFVYVYFCIIQESVTVLGHFLLIFCLSIFLLVTINGYFYSIVHVIVFFVYIYNIKLFIYINSMICFLKILLLF